MGITPFGGREFVITLAGVFLLGVKVGQWLGGYGWQHPELLVAGAVVALNVLTLREVWYEWRRRRAAAREKMECDLETWVAELRGVPMPRVGS